MGGRRGRGGCRSYDGPDGNIYKRKKEREWGKRKGKGVCVCIRIRQEKLAQQASKPG